MTEQEKRVVAVTVRMSEEDAQQFESLARRLWPGAVMSRSAIVLSLARIAVKNLGSKKEKGR